MRRGKTRTLDRIGMGRTTELRGVLKTRFFPFMEAKGFSIDQRHAPNFWDFRRTVNGRVQFFEIQWDKYGRPRFTANFGHVSAKGTVCYGKRVPAADIGPGQAPEYCRLHPGSGPSTRHWFRQDRSLLSALFKGRLHAPERPVLQLIELFAEAEAYWASGRPGPHSNLITNTWAQDAV